MASFPEGISILIPIYNFDVQNLIEDLLIQTKLINIDSEIICMDDGSEKQFKIKNRDLIKLEEVQYIELKENVGRSAIRNLLSYKARFRYLLFLDCDSGLVNGKFLSNYLDSISYPVVVGGRQYSDHPPELPFLLHWTVGRSREVNTARERNLKPYQNLMFNNIFIYKDVFLAITLDESIKSYGHEDTKFGNLLESHSIPILHIDNPTLHIGLDSSAFFLRKTVEGVINLYKLSAQGFGIHSSLYKSFYLIKKMKGLSFFYFVCAPFTSFIQNQLSGKNPSLILYDIFKLFHLVKYHLKK